MKYLVGLLVLIALSEVTPAQAAGRICGTPEGVPGLGTAGPFPNRPVPATRTQPRAVEGYNVHLLKDGSNVAVKLDGSYHELKGGNSFYQFYLHNFPGRNVKITWKWCK